MTTVAFITFKNTGKRYEARVACRDSLGPLCSDDNVRCAFWHIAQCGDMTHGICHGPAGVFFVEAPLDQE